MLALQREDGRWAERRGPYPCDPAGRQDQENCRRVRALFPSKDEPPKWVTAKAMNVLRLALPGDDSAARPAQSEAGK